MNNKGGNKINRRKCPLTPDPEGKYCADYCQWYDNARKEKIMNIYSNDIVGKFKGVLVKRPFSTRFNVRSNIFKRYFYDRAKPAVVKGRQKIDCIRSIVTKRDSG